MTAEFRQQLQHALGSAFIVERELGGGGMSRVFLADEVRFNRRVVIKVLSPELTADISVARFEREIALAAGLQHSHIVSVITAGDVAGLPWYSMPYIDGEDLRNRLRRGRVPLEEALTILRDVASALAYAHARRVVHRDIKPENILLAHGSAVVTDFGIAKALERSRTESGVGAGDPSRLTATGISLGTPAYIAPEQAAGDTATDHRADIYAWGVVAYELLTGNHPFAHCRSVHHVIAAHLSETPRSMAASGITLSGALDELVMSCLAKDPADRPTSGDVLLQRLNSLVATAGNLADEARPRALSATRSAKARARRIGVAIGLVVAAVGAWFADRRAPAGISTVDEAAVVVLPFRISGNAEQYLREGMLDLLAAKLTGEGGLRALDPATTLAAWRAAVRDEQRDLPRGEAVSLANRLRVGGLIEGTVVATPGHLTLSAVLLSAPDGRERGRAGVSGPADSLLALVERLTSQLLEKQAGSQGRPIEANSTSSLPALRKYLDGQALLRRGRFADATTSFNEALAGDSTFALAALGAMEVIIFHGAQIPPPRLSRLGWTNRGRLTERDQAYLVALLGGRRYPLPTSLPERLVDWQRAVELSPTRPAVWSRLGDFYWHYGAIMEVDSFADLARTAFERALALDSAYVPAMLHLIHMAALRGDSAPAMRWLRRFEAADSGAHALDSYRWMAATGIGDSVQMRELSSDFKTMTDESLERIGQWSSLSSFTPRDGQRALDLLWDRVGMAPASAAAVNASMRRAELLYNMGRPAAARRALVSTPGDSAFDRRWAVHASLVSGVDTVAGALAAAALAASARGERSQDQSHRAQREIDGCFAALWSLSRGDERPAVATIVQLRAIDSTRVDPAMMSQTQHCALLLEAQLRVRQRSADARSLVQRLDSALRTRPYELLEVLSVFFLSRTWDERGEPARALRVIRRREWNVAFSADAQWREEGRLAALAGEREEAIRAFRASLALSYAPEPALQPAVERARAALSRLTSTAQR